MKYMLKIILDENNKVVEFPNIETPNSIYVETDMSPVLIHSSAHDIYYIDNKLIVADKEGYIKPIELVINEIRNEYAVYVKDIVWETPEQEVSTFSIQKEEAKAWSKDNTEETPFIDGILTKRTDITKSELVEKILNKAYKYAYSIGIATGDRQQKEKDAISNTVKEINVNNNID